jgi:peptidyl-prolyl cis-trans isomerase NIMA-interacting 1
MRGAALLLPALCAGLALSCGGAKPPPVSPDDGSDSVLETPETRCLALANGERERRRDEPETISVKHVLVHFASAKKAKPEVKRTRADACLRALEARKQLEAGEEFAEVVASYSDEPGAATREGLVGKITRKDVVPAFADAAFELDTNEVSHVVETEFGFHVILRTE